MDDNDRSPEQWLEAARDGFVTDEPMTHPDPAFSELLAEARRQRTIAHGLVTSLGDLRRLTGQNQTQLARRWGRGQSHVSKVERDPSRVELNTLIGYTQALGGRLTITIEAGGNVYYMDVLTGEELPTQRNDQQELTA